MYLWAISLIWVYMLKSEDMCCDIFSNWIPYQISTLICTILGPQFFVSIFFVIVDKTFQYIVDFILFWFAKAQLQIFS